MDATTLPGALRQSPFALLAWVLSALTPADLLSGASRAVVLRVLLDVRRAVLAATFPDSAEDERTIVHALAERARRAVVALGEDHRALAEVALPPPIAIVDGKTVARVVLALTDALVARGIRDARLLPVTLDQAFTEEIATRATALNVRPRDKPPAPTEGAAQKGGRKPKRSGR